MKSRFVCLQIKNKKFKRDYSERKVFKNRALFSKSHSDFFQDYTERDWTACEIFQKMPKNLKQPETKISSFKPFSRRGFWADAWQRSPRSWYCKCPRHSLQVCTPFYSRRVWRSFSHRDSIWNHDKIFSSNPVAWIFLWNTTE